MNEMTTEQQEVFSKIIEIMANVTYDDICQSEPGYGDALEMVEAYTSEGIVELGDETRGKINYHMYDLLIPSILKRTKELHQEVENLYK